MSKREQKGALPLSLPEITEILTARAQLRDGKLTPWSEVAQETRHSLTKVYEVWRWFLSLSWDEVRSFSEDVQRLRPDYLEMKAKQLETRQTPSVGVRCAEDFGKAISLWIEKQRLASDQEIANLSGGNLNAWGVVAQATPGGQVGSMLAISSHPLYESLRANLVPPIVSAGFWAKVTNAQQLAHTLLADALDLLKEIEKVAQQCSGFDITGDGWQEGTVTGLTRLYIQTVFENAVGISRFTNWAYSIWTIAWPLSGGFIITSLHEGLHLLQFRGFDPAIVTTHFLTGELWTLPKSPAERIAYGNADLLSPVELRFMLCFGDLVMAITWTPQELEVCQAGHQNLIQQCMLWQKAANLRQIRTCLDSLNAEISRQLERALYSPYLPR